MKKRIMSLVLSVVLLVSFFSVGAVKANAASNLTPSDECIDMLKAFEGFCAKPYWDYSQYTIGYGTVCPSEHYDRYVAEGISEEEAEQLLRSFLTGMCNVINSFADQNGITLTQQQFDALVLFTYNCGSGWMRDSEGMFKNAVVQGKTGNDQLHDRYSDRHSIIIHTEHNSLPRVLMHISQFGNHNGKN